MTSYEEETIRVKEQREKESLHDEELTEDFPRL